MARLELDYPELEELERLLHRSAPQTRSDRPWRGLLAYALVTFTLSWAPAALLHWFWESARAPVALRMAAVAGSYALCMGWQPLVATWIARHWVDRVNLDDVLRTPKPRFYGIATAGPLVLAGLAMLVSVLLAGSATPPASEAWDGSLSILLLVMLSMGVGMLLIWIQALAEELGWRGYFLPRLMEQCGPVTGLALHGVIWGLWYAPILLMANAHNTGSAVSSGSFVITCILLGVLFGWLRLAARSVVPATLANSLLTLAAGLPFILDGSEPGIRAAIYGPAGWLPLGLAVLIVLVTRLRQEVRTPAIEVVGSKPGIWLVMLPEPTEKRTLH